MIVEYFVGLCGNSFMKQIILYPTYNFESVFQSTNATIDSNLPKGEIIYTLQRA